MLPLKYRYGNYEIYTLNWNTQGETGFIRYSEKKFDSLVAAQKCGYQVGGKTREATKIWEFERYSMEIR
jgi:hypothetical protein